MLFHGWLKVRISFQVCERKTAAEPIMKSKVPSAVRLIWGMKAMEPTR
jgi:hypothetical protein